MKRIFALFLCLITVLSCAPMSYAASFDIEETDPNYIYDSDVLEDLSSVYIDGVLFDESAYPSDPDADYMTLIHFQEYGYHPDSVAYYTLLFYVYNPAALTVSETFGDCSVQICPNVPTLDHGYEKMELYFLDQSEDGRFLKFSVFPDYGDGLITDHLDPEARKYSISGIEITTKEKGRVEYGIAGEYVFTGSQFEGDLASEATTLLTLELDLKDTWYRTETSSEGAYHQNQLDAVYFSIPDFFLETYGEEIYRIRFQMSKEKITGIVTSNSAAYRACLPYISAGIKPSSMSDFGETEKAHSETINYFFQTHVLEDWSLSRAYSWNAPGYTVRELLTFFGYVYDVDSFSVSEDEMLTYWDKYGFLEESLLDSVPLDIYELDLNDTFTGLNFNSNHNFFEAFLNYGLGWRDALDDSTDFSEVPVFAKVEAKDVSDLLDDELIAKYYLNEYDMADFKSYVNGASLTGNTVYLFRFNVQDYTSIPGFMLEEIPNILAAPDCDSYYFSEYIYRDFDILEIDLQDKYGNVTILPVISSPIDIVPDASAPFVPEFDFLGITLPSFSVNDSLQQILSIVALILVIALIAFLVIKLIPKRVRVKTDSGRRRRRR